MCPDKHDKPEIIMGHQSQPLSPDFGFEFTRMLCAVKLTPQQAATLWNISIEHINNVRIGKEPPSAELEQAIDTYPPLTVTSLYAESVRHLIPTRDNSKHGIVIKTETDARSTCREHYRDMNGQPVHVINYLDSAVMTNSEMTILPEAIWMQLVTEKPEDLGGFATLVNTGHFEQQINLYRGDVNMFFFDKNKKPHCSEMQKGDMNYITPFVPHLFTKRKENEEGYIIAVTFRGALGRPEFLNRIRTMTKIEFLEKARRKLEEIQNGPEIELMAINPGTFVTRYKDAKTETYGNYQRKILMQGVPFQPAVIACEYTFENDHEVLNKEPDLQLDCEQFIYIFDAPVKFVAHGYNEVLENGSSIAIKRGIRHGFSPAGKGDPKIFCIQADDKGADPWGVVALSLLFSGEEGAARIRENDTMWAGENLPRQLK